MLLRNFEEKGKASGWWPTSIMPVADGAYARYGWSARSLRTDHTLIADGLYARRGRTIRSSRTSYVGSLYFGNNLDLDESTLGQRLHGDGRAGRVGLLEEL